MVFEIWTKIYEKNGVVIGIFEIIKFKQENK